MSVNGSGRNEQFYREHAIDASYQVSVHLAKRFQSRRFLNIDQSEARIAYGGHVPVYDKRLSEDEGGWSDEDDENELEELQTERRLVFFLFKRINM
jgi:hypothetical protein